MAEESERERRRDESYDEKLDRELLELLNEVRVAMPGVQILFGFLLSVPFQMRFDRITDFQRMTYFVTLLAAATATAFLVAPTAYHRIMFRRRDKPALVETSSAYVIAALVSLALAMVGAVMLVTDVLFESATVAVTVAGVALLYGTLWFAFALSRRLRGERSW